MGERADILKIQRFSINDGPGIRTTVFLKGCPLRCAWCHNPDSMYREWQLVLAHRLCTHCSACVPACEAGVHSVSEGAHTVDFAACTLCGKCVEACPRSALSISGRSASVEQIIELALRDADYYRESGGGITLSGGEPTMQHEFVEALFTEAHRVGISTALDTSGHCRREAFVRLLTHTDHLLFDLKIMDPELHRQYTGADNMLIHNNFKCAIDRGADITVRHIVVPGVNDTPAENEALAAFMLGCGFRGSLSLLPYHAMALSKYEDIGMVYRLSEVIAPADAYMKELDEFFNRAGIRCRIN
ncbi:pyruvate formate lyase-activating protein [Bacteroidia bacterium]|nr:pyruvate formate lyase-activating protein [Bacteroidia bacterium]